jgi:hypothetical protein
MLSEARHLRSLNSNKDQLHGRHTEQMKMGNWEGLHIKYYSFGLKATCRRFWAFLRGFALIFYCIRRHGSTSIWDLTSRLDALVLEFKSRMGLVSLTPDICTPKYEGASESPSKAPSFYGSLLTNCLQCVHSWFIHSMFLL